MTPTELHDEIDRLITIIERQQREFEVCADRIAERDRLEVENRRLAGLLLSPFVFIHESVVADVDAALAPYLGGVPA